MKKFWMFIIMTAAALAVMASAQAQQIRQVSGVVKDKAGEVMIGVIIQEAGTTNWTVTDKYGQYYIRITTSNPALIFSFIGYKTVAIPAGKRNVINVIMEEDSETLEEVTPVPAPTDQKE